MTLLNFIIPVWDRHCDYSTRAPKDLATPLDTRIHNCRDMKLLELVFILINWNLSRTELQGFPFQAGSVSYVYLRSLDTLKSFLLTMVFRCAQVPFHRTGIGRHTDGDVMLVKIRMSRNLGLTHLQRNLISLTNCELLPENCSLR